MLVMFLPFSSTVENRNISQTHDEIIMGVL